MNVFRPEQMESRGFEHNHDKSADEWFCLLMFKMRSRSQMWGFDGQNIGAENLVCGLRKIVIAGMIAIGAF